MEKHADIYFIAPGGIGTMDEFFQILTLKYLKQIDTPIVILNINGFYDSLIAFLKDLIASKAVLPEILSFFDVVTSVDDDTVINRLKEIQEN